MSSRTFLLVSEWSWDHHHTEYATFSIEHGEMENDPQSPIFWRKPLDQTNLSAYLEIHGDSIRRAIKNIAEQQFGGMMGKIQYEALFVVNETDDELVRVAIDSPCDRDHQLGLIPLTFELEMLCHLNEEGEPVLV